MKPLQSKRSTSRAKACCVSVDKAVPLNPEQKKIGENFKK